MKEKKQYNSFYINTRKARRQRARMKMKEEGIQKMNMRPWITLTNGLRERADSYFAEHWREYSEAPKI